MTEYEDREYSAHDGSPVEGYNFIGTFTTYRYTSAERDVTIGGNLYTAIPIKRAAINSGTQDDDNLDLELTLPFNLQVVQDYAFQVSPPDLSLEIVRYHEGSDPATDFIIVWKGIVTSFSASGHEVKVLVPSIFSIMMSGEVPNKYFHNPCNHVLYDSHCGLTAASYQQDTTITDVDEDTITVAADGFDDEYLRAGEMVNTTKSQRRLIIDNVSDVITIAYPFYNAEVGDSVSLFAGCNHSFSICLSKFSNTINYGGFPYIPKENPFESEL